MASSTARWIYKRDLQDQRQWRRLVGEVGELAVAAELERRGWHVQDLNFDRVSPNVDLVATKGELKRFIQVKTYNDYRWISGGGVNPAICAGASIFNKVAYAPRCDFVICVTPAEKGDRDIIRHHWRYFVMPVADAERAFRINIDNYFNTPNKKGQPRQKSGACQDFVGPGTINSNIVPDHKEDYLPYEGAFQLLDGIA